MCISDEDFPPMPALSSDHLYSLDQGVFFEMLQKTSYSASNDETRISLNGVFVSFKDDKLSVVATDGKRLALVEQEVEFPEKEDVDFILPIKTVNELLKTLSGDGLVKIHVDKHQVSFEFGSMLIVTKLIDETVLFMNGFAKEKNIKLKAETGEIPIIEADPDRITQVLRNLINNAIKFSKKNSTIEISAHRKNNEILFSVRDYGVGLSPENQIKIFEPFYQVECTNRRSHCGTGIGLAICRGIVESQQGKIWVDSKLEN